MGPREVEILRQERDILKKARRASFRTSPHEVCVHCGASGRVSGGADVPSAVPVSVSGYDASRHRPVSQQKPRRCQTGGRNPKPVPGISRLSMAVPVFPLLCGIVDGGVDANVWCA
jgi:hypothetical protein